MTEPVLCPYCGAEMRLDADSTHIWAKCTNKKCYSTGPKRYRPDFHTYKFSCADWDAFWNNCKEIALTAAQPRYTPPAKPLTLEDVLNLWSTPNDVVYWIDHRDDYSGWRFIRQICEGVDFNDPEHIKRIAEGYGKNYLLFRNKPTVEELNAVKWRDDNE